MGPLKGKGRREVGSLFPLQTDWSGLYQSFPPRFFERDLTLEGET